VRRARSDARIKQNLEKFLTTEREDTRALRQAVFPIVAFLFAAFFVPLPLRDDWQQEWEAEILHSSDELRREQRFTPYAQVALFIRCLGSLPDALWLCRHEWRADMLIQDVRYSIRGSQTQQGK